MLTDKSRGRFLVVVVALVLSTYACLAQTGAAAGNEHWVATWATAHVQAPPVRPGPVGQPVAAAQQALSGFNNQTIRMIVPASIGGRKLRVQFSNAYSSAPLTLAAAHVAVHAKDSAIVPDSDRVLSFGGKPGLTIPGGAGAVSDPIDLDVPPLGELAVSVYVPGATGSPTMHAVGLHTTYVSKRGDMTGQQIIEDAATTESWYWVSAIDVLAPADAAAIVAFGDSITDGFRSTPNANHGWTNRFAQRLLGDPRTAKISVTNLGIAGNRVLKDGVGTNALARFGRDALEQAGTKWVLVLEGINDIGQGTGPNATSADALTADDVIAGLRQLAEQSHLRGLKVIGGTLLPYQGANYYSEKGESIRGTINAWIRTGGAFDAVVDFDAATRDPENPKQIRREFDAGDHLHPNDAGYEAMAAAIDLATFTSNPVSASERGR